MRSQPGAQGPLARSCLEVIPRQDWLSHLRSHTFVCLRFIPPLPCLGSRSFSRDRDQALKLLLSCHWQGDKYPQIPAGPHFTPTAVPLDRLPWLSTSLRNDTFSISLSGLAPIRHNPTPPQGCTEREMDSSSLGCSRVLSHYGYSQLYTEYYSDFRSHGDYPSGSLSTSCLPHTLSKCNPSGGFSIFPRSPHPPAPPPLSQKYPCASLGVRVDPALSGNELPGWTRAASGSFTLLANTRISPGQQRQG